MLFSLITKVLTKISVFAARPQTVGSYLRLHPEIDEFWLQAGRCICRYKVHDNHLPDWRLHKKDTIVQIEHLDGEPVVLHITESTSRKEVPNAI